MDHAISPNKWCMGKCGTIIAKTVDDSSASDEPLVIFAQQNILCPKFFVERTAFFENFDSITSKQQVVVLRKKDLIAFLSSSPFLYFNKPLANYVFECLHFNNFLSLKLRWEMEYCVTKGYCVNYFDIFPGWNP